MPPKVKVTKADIINASVNMVREKGVDALNARALAMCIGCSTQPIFSNFASMEELKEEMIQVASDVYQRFLREDMLSDRYPMYKASGMAYIRFAKEEKELFKLLFMRDRSKEQISGDFDDSTKEIISLIQKNIGFSYEKAKLFHLEMWIYVHGIATMLATSYLPLEWDDISRIVTDAYEGMKERYLKEEG